jgi:hypothetical protein
MYGVSGSLLRLYIPPRKPLCPERYTHWMLSMRTYTTSAIDDAASDPDAPALRRPDGTVLDRFGARGMTHEALEREALSVRSSNPP